MRKLVLFVLVLAALVMGGWTWGNDKAHASTAPTPSMHYDDGGGGGGTAQEPPFGCGPGYYGQWAYYSPWWGVTQAFWWVCSPFPWSHWEGPYDGYQGSHL